jgi:NDP-sugar pyrophosphorylase family protein
MGIYIFNSQIVQYVDQQKYLDFPDLVKKLLSDNSKVLSYPFNGYWLDIGNHSDYEKALEEYEAIKEELHID